MKVGFTTSIPVEVIYAAGHTPVDLNNIFINDSPEVLVQEAEFEGFPRNICAWIKGMYSTIIRNDIDLVVGVVQGDCSNTHSLMSILQDKKIPVIPFSYPFNRSYKELDYEISRIEKFFRVSRADVEEAKTRLDKIRRKLLKLDQLTYAENKVSGLENHQWLVSSTDFNGDPDSFEKDLDFFLSGAVARKSSKPLLRIGYIGVPHIYSNLYQFLTQKETDVVYNEVQRQFSMPYLRKNIVTQYLAFTYPYDIFQRIADISEEIGNREIDCVISYSQAFCHRQIDNLLLKKYLDKPVMVLEGDRPSCLDERTKIRLESFIEVVQFD